MRFAKFFAVGLITVLSAATVWAEDSYSRVSTYACYRTSMITEWKYTASNNVKNGVRERRAYLQLRFAEGRDSRGMITGSVVKIPLKGLYWDQTFEKVIFSGDADHPPIVCAEETWKGQKRYDKACLLEGSITDRPDLAPSYCPGEAMSVFSGAIRIRH